MVGDIEVVEILPLGGLGVIGRLFLGAAFLALGGHFRIRVTLRKVDDGLLQLVESGANRELIAKDENEHKEDQDHQHGHQRAYAPQAFGHIVAEQAGDKRVVALVEKEAEENGKPRHCQHHIDGGQEQREGRLAEGHSEAVEEEEEGKADGENAEELVDKKVGEVGAPAEGDVLGGNGLVVAEHIGDVIVGVEIEGDNGECQQDGEGHNDHAVSLDGCRAGDGLPEASARFLGLAFGRALGLFLGFRGHGFLLHLRVLPQSGSLAFPM